EFGAARARRLDFSECGLDQIALAVVGSFDIDGRSGFCPGRMLTNCQWRPKTPQAYNQQNGKSETEATGCWAAISQIAHGELSLPPAHVNLPLATALTADNLDQYTAVAPVL